MIEGYLKGRQVLRGLVMIVDARYPPTPLDREMRAYLQMEKLPHLVVLTKVDKVNRGVRHRHREAAAEVLGIQDPEEILLFSAVTGEGERELWHRLAWYLQERKEGSIDEKG